jgi:hypothetical protein
MSSGWIRPDGSYEMRRPPLNSSGGLREQMTGFIGIDYQ